MPIGPTNNAQAGFCGLGYPRNQGGTVRWQDYISVDPAIAHGKACIRGTRIPVAVVLANLAQGTTPDKIIQSYPGLTRPAIQAALGYAAKRL